MPALLLCVHANGVAGMALSLLNDVLKYPEDSFSTNEGNLRFP